MDSTKLSVEDINKLLDAVPPPKRGRERHDSIELKAKVAAKRIKRQVELKIKVLAGQAEKARATRDGVKQIEKALSPTAPSIVTVETLVQAPPNLQKHAEEHIDFRPNPGPQTDFLAANEQEVFYGGARGGGKSYSLIIDPLRYCGHSDHSGLILRRTMPELRDLINHSLRLYSKAYPGAKWREQEKEWRFPSGARQEFGYAENRSDALRYQGRAYNWIGIDELPQFPDPGILNDLRGSLRHATIDPDNSLPLFIRCTGNPGNVGSAWVKEMFIDPAPANTRFNVEVQTTKGVKVVTRRFIPAKLSDNPYLTQNDAYLIMLASLPEIQRRQWLEGDWSAWDGAAFPEFRVDTHVVIPYEIPKSWIKFRCADWGFASPACVLWIAVDYDNNLVVYRELYGKGRTADIFARVVKEMESKDNNIQYGVLDSSVWAKRGDIGPSIVETMLKEGIRWRPSDRSPGSRKAGKMELHKRLRVNEEVGKPSLTIFNTCRNIIRELTTLPQDENDPEDVDTNFSDHAFDALRYGVMSRPIGPTEFGWALTKLKEEYQSEQIADSTFGY